MVLLKSMRRGADQCGWVRIGTNRRLRTWPTVRIVCARIRINAHAFAMLNMHYYACGRVRNVAEANGSAPDDSQGLLALTSFNPHAPAAFLIRPHRFKQNQFSKLASR